MTIVPYPGFDKQATINTAKYFNAVLVHDMENLKLPTIKEIPISAGPQMTNVTIDVMVLRGGHNNKREQRARQNLHRRKI